MLTLGRMVASLSPVSKYLNTVVTFSISLAVNWSSSKLPGCMLWFMLVLLGALVLESSELWGVRGGLVLESFFIVIQWDCSGSTKKICWCESKFSLKIPGVTRFDLQESCCYWKMRVDIWYVPRILLFLKSKYIFNKGYSKLLYQVFHHHVSSNIIRKNLILYLFSALSESKCKI